MQYLEKVGAAGGTPSVLFLIRNGAAVILIADYVYALTFNYLPDGPRLAFAGGVFVLSTAMAVIAYIHRPSNTSNLIVLSMIVICACWGLSYATGYGGGGQGYTFQSAAKFLGVYMLALWAFAYPEALPRRLIAFLAVATLIGGGGYAIFAPRVNLGGEEYFAYLTGVPQSYGALALAGKISVFVGARHSSALFILLNVLLVDQLRRLRVLPPIFAWLLVALGAYVITGYWSRNTMLDVAVYFLGVFYYDSRIKNVMAPTYFLLFGLLLVAALAAISFVSTYELYYWGSGRVGTYVHRVDLLAQRDLGSLLVGTGLGSDWFRSYTWLSTEKNAHNLYLSDFIEIGLIGILGHFILLAVIYLNLPKGRAKSFFYMIVSSGLISHGFIADSQFRSMLFAAMALAIVSYREETRGTLR